MKTYLLAFITTCALLAVNTFAPAQGIDTTIPDLPPDGKYISPDEYHEYSAMGIILDDPVHRPLVGTTVRTPVGPDEMEHFDSVFTANEIGLGPITLTGPTTVRTLNKVGNTTGTFDTEIVSMNLTGSTAFGPIIIREDYYAPSAGQTTITDIGGGLYHIDSFFDVFTELSVDGGMSWIASDYPTRMELAPLSLIPVTFEDSPEQDPLRDGTRMVHELGINFPPDTLIDASELPTDETACPFPPGDDPAIPNYLITMTNQNPTDWAEVWYVADGLDAYIPLETSITNFDGIVHGPNGSGLAFKIDQDGVNRPLVSESLIPDGIFQSGETWEFIIQDYQNIHGLPASALASQSVTSFGDLESSGSIIAVPVPEPMTLSALTLAAIASLIRRRK